jgi:23S rRNA pseudouridine1911/1915/1917 synthase
MAHMGCPIWGDTKYNSGENVDKSWKNIALCAYHLEFVHPKTKKKMVFEVEPEGEGFQL